MSFIEKILTLGVFNDGQKIGMWSFDELQDKIYHSSKPFTFAEKHAMMFFEEMGDYMGPRETWTRPYGKVLNETRKLH